MYNLVKLLKNNYKNTKPINIKDIQSNKKGYTIFLWSDINFTLAFPVMMTGYIKWYVSQFYFGSNTKL